MRSRVKKQKLSPRQAFLVLCEGESEKEYVEMLKRKYRLPITIKTKVSGMSVNNRLVKSFIKELNVLGDDDCRVFFVYDGDVPEMVAKLSRIEGTLIITNPCFELWYVLHAREHTRRISSVEIVRLLSESHPVWKNYRKGAISVEQAKFLNDNCSEAISRAKRLSSGENPSTQLHVFIDILESTRNC